MKYAEFFWRGAVEYIQARSARKWVFDSLARASCLYIGGNPRSGERSYSTVLVGWGIATFLFLFASIAIAQQPPSDSASNVTVAPIDKSNGTGDVERIPAGFQSFTVDVLSTMDFAPDVQPGEQAALKYVDGDLLLARNTVFAVDRKPSGNMHVTFLVTPQQAEVLAAEIPEDHGDLHLLKPIDRWAKTPYHVATGNIIVSVSETGRAVWGFSKTTGKWSGLTVDPAATVGLRTLGAGDLAIVFPESNQANRVWSFSKTTGKWAEQRIQPPSDQRLNPIATGKVAGLQVGNKFYGYSEKLGAWDVLSLPAGREAKMEVGDVVVVDDGQTVYTFANASGQWSAPVEAVAEKAAGIEGVRFEYADVVSMCDLYRQLFQKVTFALDETTSTVWVRDATEEQMRDIAKLHEKLDRPATGSENERPRSVQSHEVDELREEFQQSERRATETAKQLRAVQTAPADDRETPKLRSLEKQLHDEVATAFASRQRLQSAEARQLQQRLDRIQQSITARERIKEKIVKHRVAELLDPNLRWDEAQPDVSGIPEPARIDSSAAVASSESKTNTTPHRAQTDATVLPQQK